MTSDGNSNIIAQNNANLERNEAAKFDPRIYSMTKVADSSQTPSNSRSIDRKEEIFREFDKDI